MVPSSKPSSSTSSLHPPSTSSPAQSSSPPPTSKPSSTPKARSSSIGSQSSASLFPSPNSNTIPTSPNSPNSLQNFDFSSLPPGYSLTFHPTNSAPQAAPSTSPVPSPAAPSIFKQPTPIIGSKSTIDKLTSENFTTWSRLVTAVLKPRHLVFLLEPPAPTLSRADLALYNEHSYILHADLTLLMDTEHVRMTEDTEHAFEIFQVLKKVYASKSAARVVHLHRKISNHRLEEGGNIRDFLTEFKHNRNDFIQVYNQVTDHLWAIMLLSSLPKSFDAFVQSINVSIGMDNLTYARAFDLVLDAHEQQVYGATSSSSSSSAFYGNKGSTNNANRPVCTHCKGVGHLIEKCWKLHGKPAGAGGNKGGNNNKGGHNQGGSQKPKGGGGGGGGGGDQGKGGGGECVHDSSSHQFYRICPNRQHRHQHFPDTLDRQRFHHGRAGGYRQMGH